MCINRLAVAKSVIARDAGDASLSTTHACDSTVKYVFGVWRSFVKGFYADQGFSRLNFAL